MRGGAGRGHFLAGLEAQEEVCNILAGEFEVLAGTAKR